MIYYDFKGPIRVNDDRKIKKVKKKNCDEEDYVESKDLKSYILSATCAMTRHTSLEVVILNEQFYIPRAQMTIKTIINRCSVCLLARCSTKKIESPTENIQNFRIPNKVGDEKNRLYKVIYFDIKGPIKVNDDRKLKKFMQHQEWI